MVRFDNWDGLSRGVWMGGFHGRKIYEREKDFSCSWSTHGLDGEGEIGASCGAWWICALDSESIRGVITTSFLPIRTFDQSCRTYPKSSRLLHIPQVSYIFSQRSPLFPCPPFRAKILLIPRSYQPPQHHLPIFAPKSSSPFASTSSSPKSTLPTESPPPSLPSQPP